MGVAPTPHIPLYVHWVGITLEIVGKVNEDVWKSSPGRGNIGRGINSPYDGVHFHTDSHFREAVEAILARLPSWYRKYHLSRGMKPENKKWKIISVYLPYLVIHIFLVSAPDNVFHFQLPQQLL